MQRLLAWILSLLTTSITVVFFYLMAIRDPWLSRPIGSSYLAAGVVVGLAAILLNVLVVAVYGVIASREDKAAQERSTDGARR